MKNIKGWKLASFALALVLLLTGAIGLVAMAAGEEPKGFEASAIDVDYINETVTVSVIDMSTYPTVDLDLDGVDSVVYYTDRYTKDVSRWNACEVRIRETKDADGKVVKKEAVAAFDISWLDDNKTVRLYLCGDVSTKVVAVDITWEEDFAVEFTGTLLSEDITEVEKWKETYAEYPNFSEDTGYLIFTLEENGRENYYFDLDTILWRKGSDGVWRNFAELDLREMNIRGIKLEFRIQASNSTKAADDTTTGSNTTKNSKAAQENNAASGTAKEVVAGARASSTAKIAIAKLADEPKLTLNPDTMSLNIRNGMEFSFDKEEWFMVPNYDKKFGEADYLIEEDVRDAAIEEIFTSEKVIELLLQELYKTKAGDFVMNSPMDKESLEAKYGKLFKFTDEGVVLYVREVATNRKAASKAEEVIIPYTPKDMATAAEDDIVFSYGESKTNSGGILVENKSAYKYQVGILTEEEYEAAANKEDIDITDVKWTAIKPGKTLKLTNKKVPKGAYLIYRIAGEDGNLPSTYEISEQILYDRLTYAGIASKKKYVGDELEAVVSTNLSIDDKGLKFQWQSCEDLEPADGTAPKWDDISGATGAKYTIAEGVVNKYIRVKIEDAHGTVLYSEETGPVKSK